MAIGKIIAVVAGIAVGGVAAYNYSTTGCPLGTGACATDEAAVTAVAADGEASCPLCPSKAGSAAEVALVSNAESSACGATEACKDAEECDASTCELGDACCAAGKSADAAEVTMVANTETAEAGCCQGKDAESCSAEAVAEGEACAEKADSCCSKSEAEQVAKND